MNFTPRHTDLRPHFNFEIARTRITVADSPAVVAWYVRVSTFSFSRLLHSANGGSNPAWDRKNRVDARWIKRRVYTGHGLRRVFLLIKRRRLCIARGVHMCVLYKFWTRKYQIFPWENLNQTPKRERQAHILSKTNNGPNKTCKTPSQTRLITKTPHGLMGVLAIFSTGTYAGIGIVCWVWKCYEKCHKKIVCFYELTE